MSTNAISEVTKSLVDKMIQKASMPNKKSSRKSKNPCPVKYRSVYPIFKYFSENFPLNPNGELTYVKVSEISINVNEDTTNPKAFINSHNRPDLIKIYNKDPENTRTYIMKKSKNNRHNRYFLKERIKDNTSETKDTSSEDHKILKLDAISRAIECYKHLYNVYKNTPFKTGDILNDTYLIEKYAVNSTSLFRAKQKINNDFTFPFYIEYLGSSRGIRFVDRQLGIQFSE